MRRLIATTLICLAPLAAQATTLAPREPARTTPPVRPVNADVAKAEALIVDYAKAVAPLAKTAADRGVAKAEREAAAARIKSLTQDLTTALKAYRPEIVAQASTAAARDAVKTGVVSERQIREIVAHVQREVQRAVAETKRPVTPPPVPVEPAPVATTPVEMPAPTATGAAGDTGSSIASALSSATSGL